jgi:sugar phosphate isomerase/epimerase
MTTAAMTIGMSLRTAYLAGDGDIIDRKLLGDPDKWLAQLRGRGVDRIELRVVGPDTSPDQAVAAYRRVRDAGMDVSIHGALPPIDCGENWPATSPAFVQLVDLLAADNQSPCAVALHAYAARDGNRDELASRTVARLRQMLAWIDRQAAPIHLALEVNRAKQTIDPGADYDGVLVMVSRIDHPRLGICWDFGHSCANARNDLSPLMPPVGFAARVAHTHIHDLAPSGETHWPLTEGRVPLDAYAAALRDADYAGVWNLELSPERFADAVDAPQCALDSVDRLKSFKA